MMRTGPIQLLLNMTLRLSVVMHIKRAIESIDIMQHRPKVQNIYSTCFSVPSPDSDMYVLLINCIAKELVSAIN